MKNVLVTGGTGYIGSHVVIELIKNNYNPIIIDLDHINTQNVLQSIEKITNHKPNYHNINMCNINDLEKILQQYNIDSVIHLASYKAVGESVEKPLMYYQNNLISVLNLLQCMENSQVEKLVFSSSATVYANNKPPFKEDIDLSRATNPYGQTKIHIEQILEDCCNAPSSKLKTCALRYFNPIGAHESGLIGEFQPLEPKNLLPAIAEVYLGRKEKLSLYGNAYPTKDGTAERDYINIMDLAAAHVTSLNILDKPETKFIAVNIGAGKAYSILDILNSFQKYSPIEIKYEFKPNRSGDIATSFADVEKSEKLLGFKTTYNLDKTMKDLITWLEYYKNNFDKKI